MVIPVQDPEPISLISGRTTCVKLGDFVRYKTAAILTIILLGGMFAVPAVILAIFLPSLQQGLPNPVPGYEQILLEIASFCMHWRFLLALPIPMVLFTIAAFARSSHVGR